MRSALAAGDWAVNTGTDSRSLDAWRGESLHKNVKLASRLSVNSHVIQVMTFMLSTGLNSFTTPSLHAFTLTHCQCRLHNTIGVSHCLHKYTGRHTRQPEWIYNHFRDRTIFWGLGILVINEGCHWPSECIRVLALTDVHAVGLC